jgi:putative redox protein
MIIAESADRKYCTHLSNGTGVVFADVTADKGGLGEHFRPHDLLCAGYAACLNITTRMLLEEMRIGYSRVTTNVDLDRTDDSKTVFVCAIDIEGDIDEATRQTVIAKALDCPVSRTLSKDIEFRCVAH